MMANDLTERRFAISGMHCQSCVTKLQNALSSVQGVGQAEVSLSPPRAVVRLRDPINDAQLSKAVEGAGAYRLTRLDDGKTTAEDHDAAAGAEESHESLYPLLLIVGFIAGVTVLSAVRVGEFEAMAMMETFMAGFFIVFGFFKLLDLPGFAEMYRTYDLLAKASPAWAWAYPFVEVALGAAYLVRFAPLATNIITLALMLVGALGVGIALLKKQRIRCACLGAVLNLPMTTVTLIEDLGMAAMAAVMIVLLLV